MQYLGHISSISQLQWYLMYFDILNNQLQLPCNTVVFCTYLVADKSNMTFKWQCTKNPATSNIMTGYNWTMNTGLDTSDCNIASLQQLPDPGEFFSHYILFQDQLELKSDTIKVNTLNLKSSA